MGECQCAIITRSQWLLGPGETWLGSSFFSPLNPATFHTCLDFNTIISWLVRYFSPLSGDWHLHKYLLPLWCDMSKVSGCTMVEKPDRSAPEYILHPWSLNFDTFISALKYSRKFLTSSCAECHLGTSFCVSTSDAYELYAFFIFKLMSVEKTKL